MTFRKLLTRGGLLIALLVWLAVTALAQGGAARVRFVHVVPGAAAIDVYINGTLALKALDYASLTTYLSVPSGTHTLSVTPSGLKNVVAEQSITVTADTITTFIASDPATLEFIAFPEKLGDPSLGKGRLQVIHAASGVPAFDLQTAEDIEIGAGVTPAETTLVNLAYNKVAEFDVEAQNYPMQLAAEGTLLLSEVNVPVASGTSHLLVVYGTANALQTLLINTPTSVPSGTGFVRFVHGIVGVPAVDVVINDTLIAPFLSTERPTEHIGLPGGEHDLVLRVAGTEDVLFEGQIEVTAGAIQSIVILQGDTEIELLALDDAIGGVTAGSAGVSVINTIPGTDAIAVQIGANPVTDDLAFGQASDAAALEPTYAPLTLSITRGDMSGSVEMPAQTFYGGVYYTLIALDGGTFSGPRLLVVPTAIAQSLASAPNAANETIVVNAAPTTAATSAAATPAAVTQVANAATAAPALPTSTLAPIATKDPTIYGRVTLDPGANLQLREFPSVDARSLGLAPSGTELIVNGREGAPVSITPDGSTPTPAPDATEFVDPVTLLDTTNPTADLVKNETWLNVTYNTPDGGAIIAWVNAQYVDVRNAADERVRLADLPPVGRNVPGESRSTAILSPIANEDLMVGLVRGLAGDANLNIRRTPETNGEVLGRVNNGTALELVGLNEAEDWAYVTHRPSEGGTVSGWVSAEFLTYQLNGVDTDLEKLKVTLAKATGQPLLQAIPEDRRGTIGESETVQTVTVNIPPAELDRNTYFAKVQLDQGANLQLRRNPSVDAESLGLLPSGTQVVATARTEAADWLRVTFEDQEGWISARYVVVTYNGNVVRVDSIPVFVDPTAATTPAAATPVATSDGTPTAVEAAPTATVTATPGA